MSDAGMMPLLTALIAAIAIAATAYAFLYPYISADRVKDKRVASVSEQRSKKVATQSAAELAANRKKQVADSLKDMENRQKAREKLSLRLRLERAGLEIEPRTYWIASAASAVALAALASTLLPASAAALRPILLVVALFVGGLGLPRFVLAKITARRQKQFLTELPNAIDVIVRGIKSGLPLNECLGVIAKESLEPVASEFRDVIEQQRVGVSLSEALDRLTRRMPLPEVKFLAIVIAIQQQSGGNLAEALANLSGVLRERFKMAMKVKALSAEAKASAMILAALPPGVMFMVTSSSPEYIAPLFSTRTGNIFILVGLAWMSIGILVMRKMINFKF
ncbi:type II secretion system F family protein [Hyphomicrobium sp.]|uniref:type II secretion system F family protein n=1 Tax=Hyphomicrobium sp. TaxID=82 RepID=UPI0025C46E28|nr:type II secretion system F family protein [Hyphomicrobium sp.]MCC7251109.1 type II secretion system F family protein [Hyphomicrobium sp.]